MVREEIDALTAEFVACDLLEETIDEIMPDLVDVAQDEFEEEADAAAAAAADGDGDGDDDGAGAQ
jgi:hypothetical protein